MLALRSDPASAPAQFAFDRGQLSGLPGVLAMVVSANETPREALEEQVIAQAVAQLGQTKLQLVQTVVEKRATFACTPGLSRPPMDIALGLRACGDYIEGPYPATLEGAVLSGLAAAKALNA
jgi:predicted NAD/FAD-dependent oxidoreductase